MNEKKTKKKQKTENNLLGKQVPDNCDTPPCKGVKGVFSRVG